MEPWMFVYDSKKNYKNFVQKVLEILID